MSKYPGNIITSGANAGYSVAFDGTGDYLTAANNVAFLFGTGDFTVEAWVYPTALSGSTNNTIACVWATSQQAWFLGINSSNTVIVGYGSGGSSGSSTFSYTFTTNQWYHLAITRSGTNLRAFVNGTQVGSTVTNSTNITSTASLSVGANLDAGPTQYWNGYISNVRVLKGTALYTAAFTPPTQLFNVPNTSLLTCNSPSIIDQSPNAFAITVNGNAAASTFTPFTGYTAYNPALGASTPGIWTVSEALEARQTRRWNMYDPYFNLTTLLLHGNGTNGAQNNTFLDSSSNNFTITRNGNTTQGTFSPFSQTGWSNYFGGSDAFRTTASSLSNSQFTVEAWGFFTGSANQQGLWDLNGGNGYGTYVAINSSTSNFEANFYSNNTGTSIGKISYAYSGLLNTWVHFATSFDGSTYRFFVNGALAGTISSSTVITATSEINISQRSGTITTGYQWVGYISNFRYVTGAALYTAAFTPPTSPLGIAGSGTTRVLYCQSNRFVDNSSSPYTFTISGTPSVQAFSPFYPLVAYTPQAQGGSGYFDGTGDYLSIADNAAFDFGSSDFTLEAFVYCTDFAPERAVLAKWTATGTANANSWYLFFNGGTAQLVTSSNGSAIDVNISGGTAYANAWNHIAASRSGNTYSLYLNGTRVATTTNANSLADVGTAVEIGRFSNGGGIYAGYISGARIVKGTAVYTGTTLTVPTAPLTAITNTSLLCNFTNAGIVDSTAKNVLETVSSVQVSTTQSKFGGSSMWFQAGGTLAMANSPNLSFGTGDFTVEWWVYWNTVPTASVGFVSGSGTGSTDIRYDGTNLRLGRFLVAFDSTFAWTAVTGQWYHVAVTRQGTSVRAFVNGTQIGTTSANSNTYNAIGNFYVGTVTFGTPGDTPLAYIDDFRITKGYARYIANFTPPTSQWQDQ